jgi:hypothetical protein
MKVICLLVVCSTALFSQSLHPNHWTQDDLRYLYHRGELWQVSPLSGPYDLQVLRPALQAAGGERGINLERFDALLQRLPQQDEELLFWVESRNAYEKGPQLELYHGTQRARFGVRVRPWLQIYHTVLADNRIDEDRNYRGKRQAGLAAYSEQAVVVAHHKQFELKFGRDFLTWGIGRDAALLKSDFCQPIDMLQLAWKSRYFKFSWFTSGLAQTRYRIDGDPSRQNRFLSGHRLEIYPWKYLHIAVSEAFLYGGVNATWKINYVHPFMFYHGEQLNGGGNGNTIGAVEMALMPLDNLMLYANLMIDDVQLENQVISDQEPNEIGILGGFNLADPFGLRGLDLFAEYTRVTNRTYNTINDWEKWLHRGQPLGHFLGNDFDRLWIGMQYWPQPGWRIGVDYEQRRDGEGRIGDDFSRPWRDLEPGESYSENFPTGVVEESGRLHLRFFYQPVYWLNIRLHAARVDIDNLNHIPDNHDDYWQFDAGVSVDFLYKVGIPR